MGKKKFPGEIQRNTAQAESSQRQQPELQQAAVGICKGASLRRRQLATRRFSKYKKNQKKNPTCNRKIFNQARGTLPYQEFKGEPYGCRDIPHHPSPGLGQQMLLITVRAGWMQPSVQLPQFYPNLAPRAFRLRFLPKRLAKRKAGDSPARELAEPSPSRRSPAACFLLRKKKKKRGTGCLTAGLGQKQRRSRD